MDPISALGLAANILQFLNFAFELLNSTHKIHSSASGVSERCQDLENVHSKLLESSNQLKDRGSLGTRSRKTQTESKYASSLNATAKACAEDCEELLKIVDRLRAKHGMQRKWWQSISKAMLEVWTSKDVERLKGRVDKQQASMTLMLCAISEWVLPWEISPVANGDL